MPLKTIFKNVLVWRILILAIAAIAMFVIPVSTRFTNLTSFTSAQNLLTMWSNFDGLHYLDIAQYHYGLPGKTDMSYAFFPVYPWFIRTFNLFGSYIVSGLFLSHLFLLLALYFLYKLILLDEKPRVAKQALFLILLFPTAFYFGSVYNESLFLLLSVLVFYFARQKKFFPAAVFAMIASATRITGIFLWVALIFEYWQAHGKEIKRMLSPNAICLALPPLGLLSYMRFLAEKTGDPLFFVHMQTSFSGRSVNKLILLYQVFYRYFKMLIFTDHNTVTFFVVLLEFLSACLILAVIIFSFKKLRFSYWIYMTLSFLLPTLSGTFASIPRYVLVLFPMFIFLASWLGNRRPLVRSLFYAICIILSILSIAFYTRGYFIA